MNHFLQKLAEKRLQFLTGLDANSEDINLDIFEDFYPDQAHFIFELLQNAEDAGATRVKFILDSDRCIFEHNGIRKFTENDVQAITGIHNRHKSKELDQIGKFGVGFKSVFVYTLTPFIQSGDYSFSIERYVLPVQRISDQTVGDNTRFEFPFNNPKKEPGAAYDEISKGLAGLDQTTLLFLPNIESISWKIGKDDLWEVQRIKHSDIHYEIIKRTRDGDLVMTDVHYLRFDQLVNDMGKQKIGVAFELGLLPNVNAYDPNNINISNQLKIIRAVPGRVSVYFPAEKEVSGLRFHLHAPFITSLDRASIKNSPGNAPLLGQLAYLTATSLHQIRDLGLLTLEFLGVLPNSRDVLPQQYNEIRSAIVKEMNNEALTPTYNKHHSPAKCLIQAKKSLKDILSEEDLKLLKPNGNSMLKWAISATQKNNDVDVFLSNLEIKLWDVDTFIDLLSSKTSVGMHFPSEALEQQQAKVDATIISWLGSKTPEWHQELYALFMDYIDSIYHKELIVSKMKQLLIVRLSDGKYCISGNCYFPSEGIEQDNNLPRVDAGVYSSGNNNIQKGRSRKFLELIGVREVDEIVKIEAILKRRYSTSRCRQDIKDLPRFYEFVENNANSTGIFSEYFIFKCSDGQWHKPNDVFLADPYMNTGLDVFYRDISPKINRFALSDCYLDSGIDKNKLVNYAIKLGVQVELMIKKTTCINNPNIKDLLARLTGRNHSTYYGVNLDFTIEYLDARLLSSNNIALSLLVWKTAVNNENKPNLVQLVLNKVIRLSSTSDAIGNNKGVDFSWISAKFRRNSAQQLTLVPSSLICLLKDTAWIPQKGGRFVKPSEASSDLLPVEFPFDPRWAWLKAVGFGEQATRETEEQTQKKAELKAAAKELGFHDEEALRRAKRFANLPVEEQERILNELEDRGEPELPEQESPNPGRREERVAGEAEKAPERSKEERTRTVSVNREKVKEDASQYLREQYTREGIMFCQVCENELPFKLDDDNYYFEKVEFITKPQLIKHHLQNYIALCPNHAAMFIHANGSKDKIKDLFANITDTRITVELAKTPCTVYFTKKHIGDLNAVLKTNDKAISEVSNISHDQEEQVSDEIDI